MGRFKKICKYSECGKEFESDARNARYCSPECCAKAQDKNYKIKKTRARKRREYSKTQEIQKALAHAYALAHRVAEVYDLPKVCECKLRGEVTEENQCSGELELHHRNLDPFCNSPWNLIWLCRKHHGQEHSKRGNVNVVQSYVSAEEKAKSCHESERGRILVETYRDLVEEA